MRIFFDTEFTGLIHNTTILSIAVITENNRTFYAEFTDYNPEQLDHLINELEFNPQLILNDKKEGYLDINHNNWTLKGKSDFVSKKLIAFLADHTSIEIWADCPSFDWILFRKIFNDEFYLPLPISNYLAPYDIYTFLKIKNIDTNIFREDFVAELLHKIPMQNQKHNALWDAWVTKLCYEKLLTL